MKTETTNVTKYYARNPFYAEVEIDDTGEGKIKEIWLCHEKYKVKVLILEIPVFNNGNKLNEDIVTDEQLIEYNIGHFIEKYQNVFRSCEEELEENEDEDVKDYLRFMASFD